LSPDPTPSATHLSEGDEPALERQRLIEQYEHSANVARLRTGLTVGMAFWIGAIAIDVLMLAPGQLPRIAMVRVSGAVIGLLTYLRVRQTPAPTAFWLLLYDFVIVATFTMHAALMALASGGLQSPAIWSLACILVARASLRAARWPLGSALFGVPILSYLATLGLAALVDPHLRAQFAHGPTLAAFVGTLAYVLLIAGLLVVGGHMVWSLRRQVFAARSVGRYRLKRRIGAGGMGEVWAARHPTLKRDVAVKILRPDGSLRGEVAITRFEREAKAMSELSHPNTVRVFDYGVTDDGLWYYAMELLDGETLATLVARQGPLTPTRAAKIALQASRALAEAHAHGIVHRDVKPENLVVIRMAGEVDFVKVLDFGIARLLSEPDHQGLTGEQIAGTPMFMAPEQALGHPVDARSDVYALGAVLYFLLTATPPFFAKNNVAVMRAHIDEPPLPPSRRLGKELPAELDALVLRCLAKNPEARFRDGEELAGALNVAINGGLDRLVTGSTVMRVATERPPYRSAETVPAARSAPSGPPERSK
jgi:serine/threonine-protein kinase